MRSRSSWATHQILGRLSRRRCSSCFSVPDWNCSSSSSPLCVSRSCASFARSLAQRSESAITTFSVATRLVDSGFCAGGSIAHGADPGEPLLSSLLPVPSFAKHGGLISHWVMCDESELSTLS